MSKKTQSFPFSVFRFSLPEGGVLCIFLEPARSSSGKERPPAVQCNDTPIVAVAAPRADDGLQYDTTYIHTYVNEHVTVAAAGNIDYTLK